MSSVFIFPLLPDIRIHSIMTNHRRVRRPLTARIALQVSGACVADLADYGSSFAANYR
jgi:hypothetical protein